MDDSQIIIQKPHHLNPQQLDYLREALRELFGPDGIMSYDQEMDFKIRPDKGYVLAVQNININSQNVSNNTELVKADTKVDEINVSDNGGFDYIAALDEMLKIGKSAFVKNIYATAVTVAGSQASAARLVGITRDTVNKALKSIKERENEEN